MTVTGERAGTTGVVLPRRMPTLDGLRGFGMAAVFVAHLVEYGGLGDSKLDRALLKVGLRGGYGVTMFFVLSGFLITGILLDTKEKPRYFRNFYARRSLRIFPLYFAFIAVVFLVVPAVMTVSGFYQRQVDQQAWYWVYLANIGVSIKGWVPGFQYFGHLWTLSLEEQFYVLWPLVVLLVSRRTLVRVCGVLFVAGLATRIGFMYGHNEVAVDVLLPSNVDALGLGALLAASARSGRPFPLVAMRRVAIVSPFVFASLTVWSSLVPATSEVMWSLQTTVAALGFASLIGLSVVAPATSPVRRVLASRPAVEAGLISYAFYVFHQPILFLVVRGWHLDAGDLPAVAGSRLPGLLLVGVVAAALSTGAAVLSWRLFEQPILRLKQRFT